MYVSRLVYMIALLEAVLWIQPNFALSWQHDMTKLLRTQTDNLNQLAQNVGGGNAVSAVFQKQVEMIARELEMIERANVQVRNSQASLLDKGAAKQATNFNPTQILPQQFAEANYGGNKGSHGAISGKSAKEGVTSGAVPLMSSSQAYAVVCCVLIACFTAFSNEFVSVSESSDSDSSVVSSPSNESGMKRPRDCDKEEEETSAADESEDESVIASADVKESRRGRKRARLGVHATSSVHFGQAKKNSRKRYAKKDNIPSCSGSEIASDESVLSSPTSSVFSPKEMQISTPVCSMSSGLYSTLPPEMACDFEAEHAFYFHGISHACSVNSSAMVSVPVSPIHTCTVPVVSASPSLESSSVYSHAAPAIAHQVTAIDPALLMEPGSPDLEQQNASFTMSSVSSGEDNSEDDESESSVDSNAPLFNVAVEPLMQDVFY